MWMSLERERIPSEMIRSTRRTTGRWLASASDATSSSGSVSGCSTKSAEPSIPCSTLSRAFSGRYISSSFSAMRDGAASSERISRAVAKASAFSASRSKGFAVATSRKESVMRSGSTR